MSRHRLTLMLAFVALAACGLSGEAQTSPDGRFRAELLRESGVHYQIVDVTTGKVVLKTRAQFPSPNDVKAGRFEPGPRPGSPVRFAAAYHYGHAGQYTWIGVWSTDGRFLYSRQKPGWTKDLADAFTDERR